MTEKFRVWLSVTAVALTAACGDATVSDPDPVAEPMIFADVQAGESHACGLTTGGSAACWGGGAAVGNSSTSGAATPTLVTGGLTFTSVTSGAFHTCATTAAGRLYCWGHGSNSELGGGWSTAACISWDRGALCSAPVAVPDSGAVAVVSAGDSHTCAVTLQSAAYCWGESIHGQLGIGPTEGRDSCEQWTDLHGPHCNVPLPVAGNISWAQVTAGSSHTCGLDTDGAAWCWGDPFQGSLGVGRVDATTPGCRTPYTGASVVCQEPLPVAGGLTFASLSAGSGHTCGVTPGGALYCWGNNSTAQLGDGTRSATDVPTPSAAGLTIRTVSSGRDHTCALTSDGKAWCWGATSGGRLGNGLAAASGCVTPTATGGYCSNPVPVAGNLTFTRLSTSGNFTCGVTVAGAVYCWGFYGPRFGPWYESGPDCSYTLDGWNYCSTPQRVQHTGR